jgi:hypothetical protein
MAIWNTSIGEVGGTLADLLSIRSGERIAAAQEGVSQAAADRAWAQQQAARSYLQENQRSLLILGAGAVILFALVWRSGKG